MLNNSIIRKPTAFLLYLRISIISVPNSNDSPNILIPYREIQDILLFSDQYK